MTRKRVGGWIWWTGGSAIAILILGGALVFLNPYILPTLFYSPFEANFDPLIHSIDSADRSFGGGESKVGPCCFKPGEDKEAVLKRQSASKFSRDPPSDHWDAKLLGADYLRPTVAIYSRTAGRFPCEYLFYIAVEFDAEDRVKKADGAKVAAACT